MKVPDPAYVYHLTHIDNLRSILDCGALLSYNAMHRDEVVYRNIAHNNIQDQRAHCFVWGAKGGCLHDYVPFHFASRPPMLYAIKGGKVEGYAEGQGPLIYLVSTAQDIAKAALSFTFTDGHAIMAFTEFYDSLDDLDKVDWSVMKSKYWHDTTEHPDRRRRRQAEFLVHDCVPIELVRGIVVKNTGRKEAVSEIVRNSSVELSVQERTSWYY